jgi:hypothetical protein
MRVSAVLFMRRYSIWPNITNSVSSVSSVPVMISLYLKRDGILMSDLTCNLICLCKTEVGRKKINGLHCSKYDLTLG